MINKARKEKKMKKEELKAIAEKYGFDILRNPITREAWALGLETAIDIPELDALLDPWTKSNIAITKTYNPYYNTHKTHYYKVICPVSWFDLSGWI